MAFLPIIRRESIGRQNGWREPSLRLLHPCDVPSIPSFAWERTHREAPLRHASRAFVSFTPASAPLSAFSAVVTTGCFAHDRNPPCAIHRSRSHLRLSRSRSRKTLAAPLRLGDPTRHFAPAAIHKPAKPAQPPMGPIAANETPLKKTFVPLRGVKSRRLPGGSGSNRGQIEVTCGANGGQNGKLPGDAPLFQAKHPANLEKHHSNSGSPMHAVLACALEAWVVCTTESAIGHSGLAQRFGR